jgi:hypothetical protein
MHFLYVSKSRNIVDEECNSFKLGATRVGREASMKDIKLLAKFEEDIVSATKSGSILKFPELDPLTVNVSTFYNFLAVHDRSQLYIEFYPLFRKLVVRFNVAGPFKDEEDVISVTWNKSQWPDDVSVETRLSICRSWITMGVLSTIAETDNIKYNESFEKECISYQTDRKRHDREIRVTEKVGNKTIMTIDKKSMSQVNHNYIRYLIKERRRKCDSLSNDWNIMLKNNSETVCQKRKWTKLLNHPQRRLSSNIGKRKEEEKLRVFQEELGGLKCALLSVQNEKERKELSDISQSIKSFLDESHNLKPISIKDRLLLATTTPGVVFDESQSRMISSEGITHLDKNWKNQLKPSDIETLNHGVENKFPRRGEFGQKSCDELELTGSELQMKENHVREQVNRIAQNLKRQIRTTKNRISSFPAEEEWEHLHRVYKRSYK